MDAFGPSYPSGHVIRATAVYVALAWSVAARSRRGTVRSAAWLAAVLIAALVGFARLYEAAHWPVDVVAGYGLGAGWLLVVLVAGGLFHRGRRGRVPARSAGHGPAEPTVRKPH